MTYRIVVFSATLLITNVGTASAATCYTTWDDGNEASRVLATDLDSEITETVATFEAVSTAGSTGLALNGDEAFVCVDGGLVRLSLIDATSEALDASCAAIGPSDAGALWLPALDWPLRRVSGAFTNEGDAFASPIEASRFAEADDRLFAAWHAASVVDVYDSATGDVVDGIPLDGFDGWIWGLAALDDELLVLGDGRGGSGPHLAAFDILTGDWLADLPVEVAEPGLVRGLWCEP